MVAQAKAENAAKVDLEKDAKEQKAEAPKETSAEVDEVLMATQDVVVESPDAITWEAQEYIVRDKTSWWYVGLAVVAIFLVALSVILHWWTFLIVVILSVVSLVIYTVRPPRIIHYSLSNRGVTEGNIMHDFADYKAFGLLQENGHFAIVMTPRKRFSPRVTVYFPEAQGEKIVDAFGAHLPMEKVELDMLDKLIKFLRI